MAKYSYEKFSRICYNGEVSWTQKQIFSMYLLTDRWESLRFKRLEIDNHRCRMCNDTAECVHHRVYPNQLGLETIDDLTSLCNRCHENFHKPPMLDDVKKQFFEVLSQGKQYNCPVCERYAKYELRPINSTQARALIWLVFKYREFGCGDIWIDVPREAPSWLTKTNQHTTLSKWGLIERSGNSNTTKKHSGNWRPTQLGCDFVDGKVTIPYKVCIWDDQKIGEVKEQISIYEALGTGGFDYKTIMENPNTEVASIDKVRISKQATLILEEIDA